MRRSWTHIAVLLAGCFAAIASLPADDSSKNLVIEPPAYRPAETVQRIAVPLPPNPLPKLLIVSGANSYEHDWTGVNNLLRYQLQETGRFDVRVTEDFSTATPELLAKYDVVLLNYLGRWNYTDEEEQRWGPQADAALFDYVKRGGGIVVYHASFNIGAPSWPEFERLAGGTMRPFHGSRRSPPNGFLVRIVDTGHPVTAGMREYFWTLNDDMYTNMKWHPEAQIRVLATAYDAAASYESARAGPKYPLHLYSPEKLAGMDGIDAEHPQIWTVEYGQGRVFCFSLGHGPDTLQYDGVRNLLARGAEWAATGAVTIPVAPGLESFPVDRDYRSAGDERSPEPAAALPGSGASDRPFCAMTPAALTKREIVAYSLGDLSCSLGWNAAAAFALYFYTDIALLPAAAIGTLFFFTRIFDAVFDIAIGLAVDRTRTRWGHARPYLLFGALPFGVLVVLTFITPDASQSVRFAWAATTYFLLGLLLSITNIPYSAMLPMMAKERRDQLKLSSARAVGTSVGVIVVTAAFMPAVGLLGGGDQERGFFLVALIIGIVATVLLLWTFANCKERFTADRRQQLAIMGGIGEMFRNGAWLVASGFAILNFIRFGAILSLTPFFAIYVLGQPWMISILMPTLSGTLLLGAFFAPPILNRLGMRRGNSLALLAAAALYVVLPFTEQAPWLFIAVYVLASLSLSITMTAIYTMASESVDYHEMRFGSRQEGLLAAGIAFAIKVGMALGTAAVAYGLAIGGYVPDQVTEQAGRTMSWLYYGIPLGVFALQLLCAQFYPMDEVRKEMQVAAEGAS